MTGASTLRPPLSWARIGAFLVTGTAYEERVAMPNGVGWR